MQEEQTQCGSSRITRDGDVELQPAEPIKLLEVNEDTIPTGIMPLQFDAVPAHGIHFPSVILEVTSEEFARIQSREIKLPDGWMVGNLLPRPTANCVQ